MRRGTAGASRSCSRSRRTSATANSTRLQKSCCNSAIDGLICTNTTIDRDAVAGHRHASEAGGLSGKPVFAKSTAVLRGMAERLGGRMPLVGVGGIVSGADAAAKIEAGASLVQFYTGMVYRGPALIGESVEAIRALPPRIRRVSEKRYHVDAAIAEGVGYTIVENASLEGRNTFRVPARAKLLIDVRRREALAELFGFAMLKSEPLLVLGEGSNILFTRDWPGIVLSIAALGIEVLRRRWRARPDPRRGRRELE